MKRNRWTPEEEREFAHAIRGELAGVATPEPTDELLRRILASRAAGARVLLPEPATPRSRWTRLLMVAGAMAAVVLVTVIPVHRRAPDALPDVVSPSVFFAREAFAQEVASARRVLPPIALSRPGGIRPLTLEFARRVRDSSGAITSESRHSLEVTASEAQGIAAWRIISVRDDPIASRPRVAVETVYVARADLRLLRRAVHVSPYSRFDRINVQQHLHGDSVTGRMTTDGPSIGSGRPIARELSPAFGPYLAEVSTPVVLMTVPLSRTWTGSAALLGWAVVPRDVYTPFEMRVTGDGRVQVPAGTFDCWRLTIDVGGKHLDYWVRKADGLGVRVSERIDEPAGGTREVVLARITE